MLQVTQEATKHLVRVRGQRGVEPDAGARFVASGEGVGLTFARSPQPADQVVEGSEISIYIAPQVAGKLDSALIDVSDRGGKTGLVMRRQAKTRASHD
jgi:Fe-S cluster assembly iron-binding protein IscA